MKSIAIISPDTVPLLLKENHPKNIFVEGKSFDIKDKCTRATSLGTRAWNFALNLSKDKDLEIILYVPDINYPGKDNIDFSNINFDIQPYNLKSATWNWSEELDRKLKGCNFVIVQSATGVGFINASVLPSSVNVILDGYVPILVELPCSLIGYSNIYKKVFWNRFFNQYKDLLTRANCILYANDRQLPYYEGQLFSLGKLDWSTYQFAPLLKVPYGVDIVENRRPKIESDKLKLLWYGPIYPWYYPEKLLEDIYDLDNVTIDFVAVKHPRWNRSYNTYFKKFFDSNENKNINIIEEYCDDKLDIYNQYDAGIVLSREWLEERYSVRGRIWDMVSRGLPVFTNRKNIIFHELENVKDTIYPISVTSLVDDLKNIKRENIKVSKESLYHIQEHMNWEKVTAPLLDYIKNFS